MMPTPASDRCPRCSAELPPGAPGGLCPRCLLLAGLDFGPSTDDQSIDDPAGPRGDRGAEGARDTMLAGLGLGPAPTLVAEETDPAPVVLPRSADDPERSPTGRYEILGEIARGGMGAVLKGRDHELGRDLAVKVLLSAHRDRPAMVRRFVEEAQIGGQLQHPAIVPVYDVGVFPDRRPFFAMKLVRGRTLAALLEARDGPEHDRPRLLGIFEQVCQAVAYAHAHGVIHRDLKPSNVMVGSFGEVQVMDWGLAKVLSRDGAHAATGPSPAIETRLDGLEAEASRAGSVMGTPSYMAPEQARGEVDRLDERADVFALGAILCEILTGRPPFTAPTRAEALRRAGSGDTAEALAGLDASGADLDLLALARACLAADPAARPRDASEVARAMSAYLAGVQERLRAAELEKAEAQARAVEEQKRRGLVLRFSAGLLTVLALGVAGVASQWRRAETHLARARQANADLLAANAAEVRAREQAQARLGLAMAAVERFHEGVSGELILRERGMQGLRTRLLGSALEFYTKLQGVLEAEQGPVASPELAEAYQRVGKLSSEIGKKGDGAEAFAKALAIRKRIARERPGVPAARFEVAAVRYQLGTALDETGRVPEARGAYERAVEEYRILDRDRPDKPYLAATARVELRLGQLLWRRMGRIAEAERHYTRAVEDFAGLVRRRPGDARVAADLSEARGALATVFWVDHRPDEALAEMARAVADHQRIQRDLPEEDTIHGRLGTGLINYGTMLVEAGRSEEALGVFRQAEEVYARLTARTPNLSNAQSYLAHALKSQGWALKRLRRYAPALEPLRRALPIWERLARDFPEVAEYQGQLSALHSELGDVLRSLGRPAEAMAELKMAVDLQEHRHRERPGDVDLNSDLVDSHLTIASTLAAMGRPAEAAASYRRALEVVAAHPSPLPSDLFNAACAHARLAVLGRDGRGPVDPAARSEAEGRLDRAMDLLKRAAAAGYREHSAYQDPDLAPLRPRADFRLLVLDLAMPDNPLAPAP